jgi:hypothetical protein
MAMASTNWQGQVVGVHAGVWWCSHPLILQGIANDYSRERSIHVVLVRALDQWAWHWRAGAWPLGNRTGQVAEQENCSVYALRESLASWHQWVVNATSADPMCAMILTDQDDSVSWRWCSFGSFSSRSAYAAMFVSQAGMPGSNILWKTIAPAENKFFLWLSM